jgi:hypothetical protein
MALPMAALGILAIASTGLKAFGALSESKAQSEAALYNAQIMQQRAYFAQQAGEFDVKNLQRAKSSMEGSQRAGYARAGVSSLSGSPLAVIADTAAQYEIDIASSRFNTQVQKMQFMSQARQDEVQAKRIRSQGRMQAFSTVLEGATNFGFNYYGGKMVGKKEASTGQRDS